MFGIKNGVICENNPELFENSNDIPYNLDEFVVASGTRIKLNKDDIIQPDYENYEYTLQRIEPKNNGFDLENAEISDDMLKYIEDWEGLEQEAYLCPSGIWTIGYGHTEGVSPGDYCSIDEAEEYLRQDITYAQNIVKQYVENGIISFDLNQNQFDALTSFAFNCGEGSLYRLANGRCAEEVAENMLLYSHSSYGDELGGLVARRQIEAEWFLS